MNYAEKLFRIGENCLENCLEQNIQIEIARESIGDKECRILRKQAGKLSPTEYRLSA